MLRNEVAALMMDAFEGGQALEWAQKYIRDNADAPHMGDCLKATPEQRAPVTCDRCVCDDVLAGADRIIALVRTDS